MTLTQLQFAAAVASQRSFSGAARLCHVSQPSLSTAVARLEEELGGAVFSRTTRRVELTPLGVTLLPLMESVLESVRHLNATAQAAVDSRIHIIRLGLSPLVSTTLLDAVLRPFQASRPDTTVVLKQCFLDDLRQRLDAGALDLAIAPAGYLARGYENCHFYTDTLQYLPCESGPAPAATNAPVTFPEIAADTFVITADGCGLTPFVRELFRKHRAKLITYPGVALNHQVIEEWVALGLGSGLLPMRKIAAQKRRARPIVNRQGKPVPVAFDLVWPRHNTAAGSHVTQLIRHFRATAHKTASTVE